jgi:hypothetical protein
MKRTTRMHGFALTIAATLGLAACGGNESGEAPAAPAPPPVAPAPPPPPPPPLGIGTAGGAVSHASGASVVVPAGALTQNTVIEIEQSSVGAPALPAGATLVGQVYAFTPHGTTFSVPVTVTVPFDPALVPSGATPALYKTNAARSAYELVAGAVVSGSSLVGEVTGFSNLAPAIPPVVVPPITLTGPPERLWAFYEYRGDGLEPVPLDSGGELADPPQAPQGDIHVPYDFGQAFFDLAYLSSDGTTMVPADGIATGEVVSFADGITYWVGAEAPLGNSALEEPIGSAAVLTQIQRYLKNADDATYSFTLTQVTLEGIDGNGALARFCPPERVVPAELAQGSGPDFYCDLISASVDLTVVMLPDESNEGRTVFSGGASLKGSAGAWEAKTVNGTGRPLFPTGQELARIDEDFRGPSGHVLIELPQPRTYSIDLSPVTTGREFYIIIQTNATTYNRANSAVGGQGAEFETATNAFLRDPATLGGITVVTTGLTPVANRHPIPTLVDAPVEPAACVPGPAPDPEAGTLQFGSATFGISESSQTPVVTVTRVGGSRGEVTATYATSNGTAVAGVDYTAKNASVFFGDGDTATRTITVPITNDALDEPNETLNLTLSQPGGCAALGAQTSTTLTIRDDDVTPQTLFTVGGTVSGLNANSTVGRGLVLTDHHGLSLTMTGDGPFTFTNLPSPSGTAYSVRVELQPLGFGGVVGRVCSVANGSGIFGNANVTDVQVTCVPP